MPRVSEEHRAARREQITAAMLRCVAREGFHKTTMAAVIEESGLSAGAVYLYFTGKQDLIRAIAETAISGVGTVVEECAGATEVPPPQRVLAAAAERVIHLGDEQGVELHRVALQTWAEAVRDPEILALVRREADRIRGAWVAYAERAVAVGHLPRDADPADAAAAMSAWLPGFLVLRLVFDDIGLEAYAAGLDDLLRR